MKHSILYQLDEPGKTRVLANLDGVYKNVLSRLADSDDPSEQFENMVVCYIFAASLIESNVNYNLRLKMDPDPAKGDLLFAAIERLELQAKIRVMQVLIAGNRPLDEFALPDLWEKKLKSVLEIRNRLIHYKDAPTKVPSDFAITDEDVRAHGNKPKAIWAKVPNARIFDELAAKKIDDVRSIALGLVEAFDALRERSLLTRRPQPEC